MNSSGSTDRITGLSPGSRVLVRGCGTHRRSPESNVDPLAGVVQVNLDSPCSSAKAQPNYTSSAARRLVQEGSG